MQLYLPTNLTKRYIINVLNDSCYSNHPCKFQYGGCWYGFQGAGCGYQHILYEPAMDIIPPIHCQNEPQHNQIPPYNPRQVQLNPVANPPQIPQQNAPNKPHNIRKTKTRSKRGKTPPLTANNSPNSPHNTKEIEVTVTPSKSTAYAPKLTASAPTFIPQTECKDATTNTASKPLVSQPDTTPKPPHKSRSKRLQNAPSYSSSDDDDDPQSKPQQLPHPKQQASGDIHLGQEEECTVNATALSHATSPGIAVESKTHDMEKKKQNIPPQYIPPQQHVKRSIEGDRTQQTTAKPPSKSQQSTPQKQPPKKKKKKKKQQAKPITNKPVVLEKKVNVEQRLAKDQMNDIESKLAALSVTDHKKKKNSNKQKRKTEKVEKKEVNDAYSYITTELMNSCRLHPEDIESLMDDESKDEAIRGLYIRAPISGSQYRVLQMEQSKHHNNNHYFLSSYGSTKCNVKLSKISSDDFEQKEINAWIMRMCKDGVTVPTQAILSETAENLTTIREAVALKKKTATLVTDEPGVVAPGTTTAAFTQPLSPPHDVQSPGPGAPAATAPTSHLMSSNTFHHQGALNYKNLAQLNRQPTNQRNFLVSKYTSAIDLGANCFWAIPTAEGDSNYICFLLMKTHRNDDHLTEAKQIAMSVRSDVMVSEIREWTARAGSKSGHWKSKGWFIDCKDSKSAYQISQKLLEFLPKTYGYGKPANFCRQVLKEFGDAYVKPRQKPRKGIKNKPMGPVFNYKDGEPSLISMSECGKPVTFRPGEKDYDAQSEYSMASISNQTVSKYDNISHMIPPRQEVNAVPYRVNDKVQYLGKKYDVVWVNGESIRIENDTESELVKPHEIRHVS
eukprot:1023761_1